MGVAQKSEMGQEEIVAAASALLYSILIIIIITHLSACYLQHITETIILGYIVLQLFNSYAIWHV